MRRRVRDVVLNRPGARPAEHPRGEPSGTVEQLVPLVRADGRADRIEELAGDAVRKAALQGEPAGGEDLRAGHLWAGAGHPEQRGLADPGGPLHQHEGTMARPGGIGRGRQRRQFRVAPENHRVTVAHVARPRTGAGYRLSVRPGKWHGNSQGAAVKTSWRWPGCAGRPPRAPWYLPRAARPAA